jgi:ketosteroid isomerase-like protein
MRFAWLLGLLVLPRTAPAQRTAADSVHMLDAAWAYAYASHDTVFAKKLFADDLIVTSMSGALKNKAGELADIRPAADLKMDYFRTDSVKVRVYGKDAAVVTGVAQWRYTYRGQPAMNKRRYTAVYIRGGPARWRMVALHLGRAPGA